MKSKQKPSSASVRPKIGTLNSINSLSLETSINLEIVGSKPAITTEKISKATPSIHNKASQSK